MEHDPKSKLPEDDANGAGQQISESRMRQALGIDARAPDSRLTERHPSDRHPSDRHPSDRHMAASHGANAQRRRFVADGDVPVVMISRGRRDHGTAERSEPNAALAERVTAMEAALAAERDARTRAETLLSDARHTIQNLQTQVAHADMAREEAAAQARRALSDRGEALKELEAALQTLANAEPVPEIKAEPAAMKPVPAAPVAAVADHRPRRFYVPEVAASGYDVPAFTAQILAAYLGRNQLPHTELPGLAESVVRALSAHAPQTAAETTPPPAARPTRGPAKRAAAAAARQPRRGAR